MTNKIGSITETLESIYLELEALNFCLKCMNQSMFKGLKNAKSPIKSYNFEVNHVM